MNYLNELLKSKVELLKRAAWNNALHIYGSDDRRDCDGRVIRWSEYGTYSTYGWHVDHIIPVALGGTDDSWNVRARHWYGNTSAGGLLSAALAPFQRS